MYAKRTYFLNKAFDWILLSQGLITGFVIKPVCEFQYKLFNLAMNLQTVEQNLTYFGKSFLKSTVNLKYFCSSSQYYMACSPQETAKDHHCVCMGGSGGGGGGGGSIA